MTAPLRQTPRTRRTAPPGLCWASAAQYSSEPRSPLLQSPSGDGRDLVPSEYSYSDALVADTDEAQDAVTLLCFSITRALRSHRANRSAAQDRTRGGATHGVGGVGSA